MLSMMRELMNRGVAARGFELVKLGLSNSFAGGTFGLPLPAKPLKREQAPPAKASTAEKASRRRGRWQVSVTFLCALSCTEAKSFAWMHGKATLVVVLFQNANLWTADGSYRPLDTKRHKERHFNCGAFFLEIFS
jgi:hypothetical protein